MGVANMIRMISPERGGRVVGEGGAICVDRKSIRSRNGSTRMLHRVMKTRMVSTISSRLLLCDTVVFSTAAATLELDLELELELELESALPARRARPDVAKGEYRREYRPRIKPATTTTGPAQRMTASPYKEMVQKPARNKKLCHGSPVLQVKRPASTFNGTMKGCEKASARVTTGGVATRSGERRWTMMLERRLVCSDEEMVEGEKAAMVGGRLSDC